MKKKATKPLPTLQEIIRAGRGRSPDAFRAIARARQLDLDERKLVLDTMERLFAGLYTHLPLKRARYGFDPVQRLRVLRSQVDAMPPDEVFNSEVAEVFARLRDWHTCYRRPGFEGKVAALPFIIESYNEGANPRYVVTKVASWLPAGSSFAPGVEVETWNSVPIDIAVQRHGQLEAGGRPDSLRAQALTTLTSRSLSYFDVPAEERVEIGYRVVGARNKPTGPRLYENFEWRVVNRHFVDRFTGKSATRRKDGGIRAKAVNHAAAEIKHAKLLMFAPHALLGKPRPQPTHPPGVIGTQVQELTTSQTGILKACTLNGPDGLYGYLRIYEFEVEKTGVFLREVRRLLKALPQRGLIIDIRDNPGGVIVAAEMTLQYLTPRPIEPTRFSLLATDFSREFCNWGRNVEEYKAWMPSLLAAIRNGEPYSAALPITHPSKCNFAGQVYGGPIVLVADSTTYSSGDLFSAGFVDNAIGTFVCVGDSTGAGGASVEDFDDLVRGLRGSTIELPALPDGAGLNISVMRATRAGPSLGTQLEDVGVPARKRYKHTRNDLLHDNVDLLAMCVGLLHEREVTRLDCEYRRDEKKLVVTTTGLNQLDVRVDRQWLPSRSVADGRHRIGIAPAARQIEVLGYVGSRLTQRRLVKV